MLTNLPTLVVLIIALVVAIFLSGLIIRTAKALGRFIIFIAVFYAMLILFGII